MKTGNALLVFSVLLFTITTSAIHNFRTAFTESFERMVHIAEEVENEVFSQLKMTTKELTLNLSGITFPGPARQGDNLNLTGLHIPGTAKCSDGYLLKGGNCQLADLLLMQDLDAQNLILGSLKLEQLKTKQQQFIQNNPNFTPLKCQGEKPFLSKQGCISCLDPHPYFNLQTLKCAKCPEGSAYISEIRNCQKGASNFLSNFENKKYLITEEKSLEKYKEQTNQRKQSDSSLETCPEDRPYSIGAECVSCPLQKPLFFLPALICTRCRDGSTFDEETNLCVSEGGNNNESKTGPGVITTNETNINETSQQQQTNSKFERERWTVQKGLSNIFGWSRDETSGIVDKAKDTQNNNQATLDSKSTRTLTTTKTTTTKTNRSIRKQTDSEDEPDQTSTKVQTSTEGNNSQQKTTDSGSQQNKESSDSNTSQTTVKNVTVEPVQEKPADEGEQKAEKEE